METIIKTNREKVIEGLRCANARLLGEVLYQFDARQGEDQDEDYDMADAFDDAASHIEENMPELKKALQDFYIHIGYAVEEDITRVVSTGKKYWFKRLGRHYACADSWEQWISS